MKRTLLTFGHGYSATALSHRLLADGWHVIGTTRSPEKAAVLEAMGVEPALWPGTDMSEAIGRATHILQSVGPDASGDPVLAACGERWRPWRSVATWHLWRSLDPLPVEY